MWAIIGGRAAPPGANAMWPNVRWSVNLRSGPESVKVNRTRTCGDNGPARIAQQQLAAHAEVGEQGVLGHRRRARRPYRHGQPQVLAAAARAGDGEPAGGGGEVVGAGRVPPDRARVQHLGRADGAADDMPFQAPADDLDLGQLRH